MDLLTGSTGSVMNPRGGGGPQIDYHSILIIFLGKNLVELNIVVPEQL